MKNTTFVYNCNSTNVGDLNSCPLDYFDFNSTNNIRVNIKEMRFDDRKKYYNDNIIFGGGGLISGKIKKMFRLLIDDKPKNCKIFAWGLGHNEKTDIKTKYKRDSIQGFIPIFDLFGVRDFFRKENHISSVGGKKYRYVPCSSCMNKVFDIKRSKPKHKIVIYDHYGHPIPSKVDYPRMVNDNVKINDVIDFLSSGELVITSAFHGAYWAMLLNKKVIVIPWASRFYGFKYTVVKSGFNDWNKYIDEAMSLSYNDYLEECRKQNKRYYREAIQLMNK